MKTSQRADSFPRCTVRPEKYLSTVSISISNLAGEEPEHEAEALFHRRVDPSALDAGDLHQRLADLHQLPLAVVLLVREVQLGHPAHVVQVDLERFGHPVHARRAVVSQEAFRDDP